MIVDLLRNDLSKSCLPDSVRVERLCDVEAFRHVLHLVSVVSGRLRDECTPLDLLRGAFPGGSITGAPKPRAMEIITELECVARGAYCGSLGYLGFDGSMDTSILIARSPPAVVGGNCPSAAAWWPRAPPKANTTKPGTRPRACCRPCKIIEAQLAYDPGRPTGGRTIGRNIRATAQLQSEHQ